MNILIRIRNKLVHLYKVRLGRIIRSFKPSALPQNPSGEVLIHIGCGELNDPRFINIDARAMPHIHYVTKNMELSQFQKNSVDLIYACHVLEHLSHRNLRRILSNWFDHLRSGGILRLSVPDFDRMVDIYNDQGKSMETILPPLMGGQEYEYNFHHSVFNQKSLSYLLRQCGFSQIREWDPKTAPYHSFEDWASAKYIIKDKEYLISLNIEAIK